MPTTKRCKRPITVTPARLTVRIGDALLAVLTPAEAVDLYQRLGQALRPAGSPTTTADTQTSTPVVDWGCARNYTVELKP